MISYLINNIYLLPRHDLPSKKVPTLQLVQSSPLASHVEQLIHNVQVLIPETLLSKYLETI
jgi:hypothetical protein